MTASIWAPGSTNVPSVDPASQLLSESFVATEGQTDFVITQFTYSINSGALTVYVNRAKLGHEFVEELTTTSFRIPACDVDDVVEVVGNVAIDDPSLYADAAAASAAEALGYKNQAEGFKNSAQSAASAASTSATNAANSATSASNSASIATTQATNAASSATAAATSATNAATSETNAANSATSASTSASTATTQATNAATSATNSANSATASASSATNAAASAAAAAASLDSFDDRYLGSKTADPTLDNDGNALVTGALYYNSVAGEMRVYDGSLWIPASAATQAILTVYRYTATAGQTTFSGNDDNSLSLAYTVGSAIVTLNGVTLEVGTNVTATTGTSIVLTVGAAAGDEVNIYAFSTFDVANTYTQAQADAEFLRKAGEDGVTVTNGNLGLGVTPSAWGGFTALQVKAAGIGSFSNSHAVFSANSFYNGSSWIYSTTDFASYYRQISGQHNWYTAPSGTAGNAISFTQAMTLDASGNLLVGTTSIPSSPGISGVAIENSVGTSGRITFGKTYSGGRDGALFFHTGTYVGGITYSNTAVAYNTASDYRLKENIQPMQNALDVVQQLNPVTYNWKADGSDGQGFIAHELQAVVPDCVTGEKDAVDEEGKPVYQGVDTSFLVATLCKAIQEQQEQINQLTAKVATLETK